MRLRHGRAPLSELGAFQDAFELALAGNQHALTPWLERAGDRGVDVYRNTTLAGSIDALAAAYPTVLKLTGEVWFRVAAVEYVRGAPPTRPSLVDYGDAFPAWLERFPPAADTPYLGSIARIDRLWWEAHFAPDADSLAGQAFAGLSEDDLGALGLELHPGVRFADFGQTVVSLWLAQQFPSPSAFMLAHKREFVLISRPGRHVDLTAIGPGEHAFFTACVNGRSLLEAAEAALTRAPEANLPTIIAFGLEKGAFARLRSVQESPSV